MGQTVSPSREQAGPVANHVYQGGRQEQLCTYPPATKALLVNQIQHMAMESITQLYHLGAGNIEFLPYYPGMEEIPPVTLAFAPGELDLVPPGITRIVDLGCRLLTANTISKIASKLDDPFFP